MQQLRARFKFDQRGDGLAVAACARQHGHRHRVQPAVAAKSQQGVDRAAFKGVVERVAGLEGKAGRRVAVTPAGAHPAFAADDHGDGFVQHLDFENGFFLGLNQGAARVGKLFGIKLDLFDHQAPQRRRVAQNFFELALFFAQRFELLLNLDGLQAGQLAQANFKNVFGLAVAEGKALHQR